MAQKTKPRWIGPFRLRDLLERSIDDDQPWPPEKKGVYVVSLQPWDSHPTKQGGILYVGGNSAESGRFLRRVGDLIIDMLGFFDSEGGHSSGGQSLWNHCNQKSINP